jgi:hypothetical protein
MTEQEWLECTDSIQMLLFLKRRRVRARRLRLFSAACCRPHWSSLTDRRSRDAIEVLEKYADGPGRKADLDALKGAFQSAKDAAAGTTVDSRPYYVANAVVRAVEPSDASWTARWTADFWLTAAGMIGQAERRKEAATQVALLRDIFDNPFRRVALNPTWLAWSDGTIPKLAQAIYDDRAFDRMPVLADALEEAGCANADLLQHCRRPGPHVRGCWVVDRLLARE